MLKSALAIGLFVLVSLALTSSIAPSVAPLGETSKDYWAWADFRDLLYYPPRAFVAGDNPYDAPPYREHYAAGSQFPLYSPMLLALGLPYTLMSIEVGRIVYVLINLGLLVLFAHVALRIAGGSASVAATFLLAALLLLSQPGRSNFRTGQVALPMVLGVLAAICFSRAKPHWAGLGFALASVKPTFGLPLAILMLARKDYKALFIGVAVAVVGALIPLTIIMAQNGGIQSFFDVVVQNQQRAGAHSAVDPLTARERMDAVAMACRLFGAGHLTASLFVPFVLLGATGWAVRQLGNDGEGRYPFGLSGMLMCLAILVTVYHLLYDGLLIVVPLLALLVAKREPWKSLPRAARWSLIGLLGFPVVSLLHTRIVAQYLTGATPDITLTDGSGGGLWAVCCSANGLSLTAALVLGVVLTARQQVWSTCESSKESPQACGDFS